MALPGLYLDESGCPGVLLGLEGLDGRPSRFFGKKTLFSPGSSRSMNRDDPGGSGINRSTAGLSGTGALNTRQFDASVEPTFAGLRGTAVQRTVIVF